jgi:hypothetical protein
LSQIHRSFVGRSSLLRKNPYRGCIKSVRLTYAGFSLLCESCSANGTPILQTRPAHRSRMRSDRSETSNCDMMQQDASQSIWKRQCAGLSGFKLIQDWRSDDFGSYPDFLDG